MDFKFESIKYNSQLPLKIFLHNLNYIQNHWHDAVEILFVLEGSIHLGIGNSVYHMHKEDLIVINSNEIHTSRADSPNLVLALQISGDWIKNNAMIQNLWIDCNSCKYDSQTQMDQIRRILASMLWFFNKQSSGFELKVQSCLFELLYKLFIYFRKIDSPQKDFYSEKYFDRISNIVKFINENYYQTILLQDLADKEYLSISYISRFFRKYIGTSFKEYIIRIRLENAMKDLLYSDKSILRLSMDNGFPNSISFLAAFKKYYNETPSLYRKKAKSDYQFLYGPNLQSRNYFEIEHFDLYSSLYKYLNIDSNQSSDDPTIDSLTLNQVKVDINQKSFPIKNNWKNLITVGKASDVLIPEIQKQLETAQNEIGFRYLRFHGIFDDDMMLYHEDEFGNPIYDFKKSDLLIDYIYSIGLKPFIELSFMPSQMAKNNQKIFYKPSVISVPKDIRNWCSLIKEFILHCMKKYGEGEVKEWYFEFWNEPEMKGVFWNDTDEEYLYFYNQTYKAIKETCPFIRIGGPAICFTENLKKWLEKYLKYCRLNKCLPDFFSFHFYLYKGYLHEVQNIVLSGNQRITLSNDPNYFQKTLSILLKKISKYAYTASQIFMTEWNASPSHRDLSHDTLYMTAYIVKSILENYEKIASFGFWTLSDNIEEYPIPHETFHGGLGLITVNGLKKAGFYGFKILNFIGDKKITSGPGYFISKDTSGIQILLYNYCHFDPLYCSMDHSAISPTNRYNIYQDSFNKTFRFALSGFPESEYEIKETAVTRAQGSVFDSWIELGAPEQLGVDDIQYLAQKAVPLKQKSKEVINKEYIFSRILAPHEVRLIRILPISSID